MENDIITIKPCKKVATKHTDGTSNGWLLEVQSDRDGFTEELKGQFYLTVADPGSVKGYHIHAVATYHVTCLKGRIRSTVYKDKNSKQAVEMGDGDFKTIKYAPGGAHLIENIGNEPAYILIYRYPSWSLDLPEQLDVPPEEIETDAAWEKIDAFVKQWQEKK
jgi:dTDP-4-dehydrorhamnose 3,5-epimerase-like enzyme